MELSVLWRTTPNVNVAFCPIATPRGSGRIREDQGGSGRIREEQGGAGRIREDQGGTGRIREDQGGSGRIREDTGRIQGGYREGYREGITGREDQDLSVCLLPDPP